MKQNIIFYFRKKGIVGNSDKIPVRELCG